MSVITLLSRSIVAKFRVSQIFTQVVLFTAPNTILPSTTFEDLTIANYSGFNAGEPFWSDPSFDQQGRAFVVSDPMVFTHNGGPNANTIRGWAILDPEGNLHVAGLLPQPKSMAVPGDSLTLVLTLDVGQRP